MEEFEFNADLPLSPSPPGGLPLTSTWTPEHLSTLPVKNGVRQRGTEITRLETFCDAAFAFAVTLLVVGGGTIPHSYQELILALKGIPAFAGSFASIAGFWWAHRTWSRRYGLEDGFTTLASLAFVFVMLVYVYPLKMVFSALASWASGGLFPTQFVLVDARSDMRGIFVIYGIGFALLTGMMALLYARVLKQRNQLALDRMEQLRTIQGFHMFLVQTLVGIASALWAFLLPPHLGVYAGFLYLILPVALPLLGKSYNRKVQKLEKELSA